jgi:hypothetical protein
MNGKSFDNRPARVGIGRKRGDNYSLKAHKLWVDDDVYAIVYVAAELRDEIQAFASFANAAQSRLNVAPGFSLLQKVARLTQQALSLFKQGSAALAFSLRKRLFSGLNISFWQMRLQMTPDRLFRYSGTFRDNFNAFAADQSRV